MPVKVAMVVTLIRAATMGPMDHLGALALVV
jgi:hypothetical protein